MSSSGFRMRGRLALTQRLRCGTSLTRTIHIKTERSSSRQLFLMLKEACFLLTRVTAQGYRILIALFSSQNSFEDIVAPYLPGVFCLESSIFSLKCPA